MWSRQVWVPGSSILLQERWQRANQKLDLHTCSGCDLCGIKCAEGVQMTREEYSAVMEFVASTPADEFQRIVEQDKTVSLGDGFTAQMCQYRDMDRGGCAVYPARPLVCRLLGHVEWMPCPVDKVEKPLPTAEALDLVREYAKEDRLTFRQWNERIEE